MGEFKKFGGYSGKRDGGKFENRSGSRPSFGGKPSYRPGPSNFTDRPMHKATCSECAKMCEVPFRPTGEKPVFCSNCFGDKKEGQSKRFDTRFEKKSFGAPDRSFTPNPNVESSARPDHRVDDLKALIDGLHAKIDRVVDMIKNVGKQSVPTVSVKEVQKVAPVVAVVKAIEKVAVKKEDTKDKKVLKPTPVVKKVVTKKVITKKK